MDSVYETVGLGSAIRLLRTPQGSDMIGAHISLDTVAKDVYVCFPRPGMRHGTVMITYADFKALKVCLKEIPVHPICGGRYSRWFVLNVVKAAKTAQAQEVLEAWARTHATYEDRLEAAATNAGIRGKRARKAWMAELRLEVTRLIRAQPNPETGNEHDSRQA